MADVDDIRTDLVAEQEDLDVLVAGLSERGWERSTPAEGWSVGDQIGHLTYFDGAAQRALTAPEQFRAEVEAVLAEGGDFTERHLAQARAMSSGELLEDWRRGRQGLLTAVARADPRVRVPWYGPPMSLASFVSARLMEAWAHGQDVADGVGVVRSPSDRLRHIAHIGVRSRPFSYTVRGRQPPPEPVAVELVAPSGERWTWDAQGAPDVVRGSALGFCLAVTQRRHVDDTDIVAEGERAREWMQVAQAFAGPPGPGRRPGQFAPLR
ncbi:MAG TPA: TIGR03084 family metal-binding protein [Acidimicrobiales bacterium]